MNNFRDCFMGLFIILWIALGVTGFLLFFVSKNVELKKRYYRWYAIGAGTLFAFFIIMAGMPIMGLLIFLPFVALITYLNLRGIKFCSSCGRTIMNQAWFSKVNYCSSCGAKLED